MRVEHSFDIHAKLYMPMHHFEFYVSFFSYVLVTCSVLWCVVTSFFAAANCPSVCLSVCLSQPLPACFITDYLCTLSDDKKRLLLLAPNFSRSYGKFQGHTGQKTKKTSETGQIKGFRAFSGERMQVKGLKYHMLLYPDHLIRFWSRSVDFTNFGGILTQWNISNVWFPYLMENAWQ